MKHSLFSALDMKINKYLSFSKNDLIKICKGKGLEVDYSDNATDLAFLIYRLETIEMMSIEDLEKALAALGFEILNKKKNQIQLVTFELCLIDLIDTPDNDIIELSKEYDVEHSNLIKDEIVVNLAVAMCR